MRGVSDALDGTNAPPGAMSALSNLVPSPSTANLFVPRPAAVALPAFAGFTAAAQITCMKTVGNAIYGFISTGRTVGFDEPFAFNLLTGTLYPISNVTAANVPATQSTTGDWTPPTADQVAGRIMLTHPGYPGGATKFGWLDISSYSLSSLTGTTHTSTLIDTLSSSPITAGVMPGMLIAGAGIPANTYVVSLTAASITLSQATTAGAPGVALTITGGTATAPIYAAGDLNQNNLPSVPLAVAQFSQRAYFAVGSGVQFSDAGLPGQSSSAGNGLNFRNGLNATALASLPLLSTTQGGIIQSLIVFQGASGMQQITGDTAFSSGITVNQITDTTGTLAPNTIVPLPGSRLAFMAPDGIRVVDNSATVSDPISQHGRGVAVPFRYALFPSRACAAFNQSVLRITVQNGSKANQPFEEYWLDLSKDENIWTGPHSFPAALIQPWQGNTNTFVMAPSPSLQTPGAIPIKWGAFTWGVPPWGGTPIAAQIWQSDPQPSVTSTYIENGSAMAWTAATVLLPDNQDASANAIIEGTLGLMLPANVSVSFLAINETGTILDQVQIVSISPAQTSWGGFAWAAANWQQQQANFVQYRLPFDGPVVFKQAIFSSTAISAAGSGIGNLYLRVEELSYDIQPGAAAA